MARNILVVEDDPDINKLLCRILEGAGYACRPAFSGSEAALWAGQYEYDLVLLDLMLPGIDGYQVCRELRTVSQVPIIMLSAKGEIFDKVLGLELGADDYVTKPFSLAVLRARVNRLLRRGSAPAAALELGPFSFDFERLRFMRNGTEVELSKTEQRLLRLLVEHRGQTLTREQLLDRVWDGGEFVDANALSVAVKRLRDKLTDAPIKTVYGLGYTWEEKR